MFYRLTLFIILKVLSNYEEERQLSDGPVTFFDIWTIPHLRKAATIGIVAFSMEITTGIYAVSMFRYDET
jgi:hypothetical protein